MASGRSALLVCLLLASCSSAPERQGVDGPCTSNRDCAEGAVCVSGRCATSPKKGCSSDDACPLGQVCDLALQSCVPTPIGPTPEGCTTDLSCPSYQRCNEATGECQNGRRSCVDDTNCTPIGQHCETTRQQCVECRVDLDCTVPKKCLEGECVDPSISTSCSDDKGCAPPSTICEAGSCARGCTSPMGLSCPAGTECAADTGRCVATTPTGCTADPECGAPAGVCEGGQCVAGCAQLGGLTCTNGQVCDSNTGRCVGILGPCSADPDCAPPDHVCELGQCIPGCARPGGVQCSGANECNTNTGRCVPRSGPICSSDLSCTPPATVCNLNTGACDPGCGQAGCPGSETCDSATGHCVGARTCPVDGYEDNDTRAAARPIGGAALNLGACPGDEDFYTLTLGANDTLDLELTFPIGEGNIDLELLDPAGTVVASGRSTQSNEPLHYVPPVGGAYVLRVFLAQDLGPTPGNTYGINLTVTPAPCGMDSYEDNDSDTTPRSINPGSFSGLNVCAMDEDWYEVSMSSGEQITVTVTFDPAEGDIDLQLKNILGINVASSGGTTGTESVTFTANLSAPYRIRVYLFADRGAVQGNPYTMTVTRGTTPPPPPPPMCTADALEENDSSAAAVAFAPGSRAGLSVCTGDDDFYRLSLQSGDRLTVNVTFTHADGDLDLQLTNPAGANVASAASTSNNETLSYTAAATGDHVLRVFLYGDAGSNPGNSYDLSVSVAGAACAPDSFEPNNSAAAAAALAAGSHMGLTACPMMDDDYYRLALTAGDNLVVDVLFTHAEGDLDVTLSNSAGAVVASSAGIVNNERVSYAVPASGDYVLRVYLYRDQGSAPGNGYSLSVTR